MPRSMTGCLVCRARKKKCDKPGSTEVCDSCVRLNIQCIRGPGRLVPPEFKDKSLKQAITRHTRRLANRTRSPLRLTDYIATSSSVVRFVTPITPIPSSVDHGVTPSVTRSVRQPTNRLDTCSIAASNTSRGILPVSHSPLPSSETRPSPVTNLSCSVVQNPVPGRHRSLEYPPCNDNVVSASWGTPRMSLPSISLDGGALPAASLPVADTVETLVSNLERPFTPTTAALRSWQQPVAHECTSPHALSRSQSRASIELRSPGDVVAGNCLDTSLNGYSLQSYFDLNIPESAGGYLCRSNIIPYDEHTVMGPLPQTLDDMGLVTTPSASSSCKQTPVHEIVNEDSERVADVSVPILRPMPQQLGVESFVSPSHEPTLLSSMEFGVFCHDRVDHSFGDYHLTDAMNETASDNQSYSSVFPQVPGPFDSGISQQPQSAAIISNEMQAMAAINTWTLLMNESKGCNPG